MQQCVAALRGGHAFRAAFRRGGLHRLSFIDCTSESWLLRWSAAFRGGITLAVTSEVPSCQASLFISSNLPRSSSPGSSFY